MKLLSTFCRLPSELPQPGWVEREPLTAPLLTGRYVALERLDHTVEASRDTLYHKLCNSAFNGRECSSCMFMPRLESGSSRKAFDTWLKRRMDPNEPEGSVYYAVVDKSMAGVEGIQGLIHGTVNRSAGVLTLASMDLCDRGDLVLVEAFYLFARYVRESDQGHTDESQVPLLLPALQAAGLAL